MNIRLIAVIYNILSAQIDVLAVFMDACLFVRVHATQRPDGACAETLRARDQMSPALPPAVQHNTSDQTQVCVHVYSSQDQ